MCNFFLKTSLYSLIVLTGMGCENSVNSLQKNIMIQDNVDLRSLNADQQHDQEIIQALDEAAVILGENSPYTGFNQVEVNGYKILYQPDRPNEILIYYQDKVVAKNEESDVTLYKADTDLPYINQQSAFFSSKDNKITYNDGTKFFTDFNLDGLDGIFHIDEVENKAAAAFLGGTLSPIDILYEGQKCELLSTEIGIGCCIVDNETELMHLKSSGWEKVKPNDEFSCE